MSKDEVRGLRETVILLEQENERLRQELGVSRVSDTIARGAFGEELVAGWAFGARAPRGLPHDLMIGALKVEVKYSGLLVQLDRKQHRVCRWTWSKIFGERGKKQFDYLVLIGEADPRFRDSYKDPASPYVVFILSYWDAIRLCGGIKAGLAGRIACTTNPLTVRAREPKWLFNDFQWRAIDVGYFFKCSQPI